MKLLLKRFNLNDHSIGFHQQTPFEDSFVNHFSVKLISSVKIIIIYYHHVKVLLTEEVSFEWAHDRNRPFALRGHVTSLLRKMKVTWFSSVDSSHATPSIRRTSFSLLVFEPARRRYAHIFPRIFGQWQITGCDLSLAKTSSVKSENF